METIQGGMTRYTHAAGDGTKLYAAAGGGRPAALVAHTATADGNRPFTLHAGAGTRLIFSDPSGRRWTGYVRADGECELHRRGESCTPDLNSNYWRFVAAEF